MEQIVKEWRVLPVPPGLVSFAWPRVEAYIDMAIAESEGDLDKMQLRGRLETGQEMLVIIMGDETLYAVTVITTMTLDAGRKILYVPLTAGTRMREWLDPYGLDFLRALAADQGCDGIRACGRPGWAKAIKTARPIHQIVEFE